MRGGCPAGGALPSLLSHLVRANDKGRERQFESQFETPLRLAVRRALRMIRVMPSARCSKRKQMSMIRRIALVVSIVFGGSLALAAAVAAAGGGGGGLDPGVYTFDNKDAGDKLSNFKARLNQG